MAMTQSLLTGVTGLKGSQLSLDVVGNNLANIGTTGFKASRIGFADLLSQSLMSAQGSDPAANRGGINPGQQGTGLRVSAVDSDFTQGTLLVSGRPTDLALHGDGFFVLTSGTEQTYSRSGSFRFDSLGRLVSPDGKLVQGWMARGNSADPLAPPVLDTSNPAEIGNIQITQGMTIQARETSILNFVGNLDAGATYEALGLPQATWVSQLPVTHEIRTTIVDSLGNEHPLVLQLKNISGIYDDEAISNVTGAVNDPVLTTAALPQQPGLDIYPNNTWRFEFFIDPSDTTAVLAPDGTFVGQEAPDLASVPPLPATYKMFARSGYLTFDTNGGLQEVRYGKVFDLPVGVWPEQTVDYTVFPFQTVTKPMGPAPLLLLFQNVPEPSAPGGVNGPRGTTAGERIMDKYLAEDAAGGYNHLLQATRLATPPPPAPPVPLLPFPVYVGPPTLLDGLGAQYLVVDDPANPNSFAVGTQAPVGFPMVPQLPGTGRADFYCQEINPFFGTGGYLTGQNRTPPLVTASGNSLTWSYDEVAGGTRDGLTQDTTGEFRLVAGAEQYFSRNDARVRDQDGYRAGLLSSLSVDSLGRIQGSFDNGMTLALGQLAIANFENPRGLSRVGATEFDVTANSGSVRIGSAEQGGRGTVVSGVLEQSNVDASRELSEMIVAQRSFEANSRIISTADGILETLANLGT